MKHFVGLLFMTLFVAANRWNVNGKTIVEHETLSLESAIKLNREIRDENIESLATCSQNYNPCTCNMDTANANAITVTCVNADPALIKSAFGRSTDLSIYKFELYHTTVPTTTVILPADLLSDKKVSYIHIGCSKTDGTCPMIPLKIDPDAFRFTRRYTLEFHLKHVSFDSTSTFGFLSGMEAVTTFTMDNYQQIPGAAFEIAPFNTMIAMTTMAFTNGRDTSLGSLSFPDITPVKLLSFNLTGNNLEYNDINGRILLSLSGSTSATTIEYFGLGGNALNLVPNRLQSFSKVKVLEMGSNSIPYVTQSRLNFPTPPTSVDLQKNAIKSIDAGAFVGDFSKTKVNLAENQLPTLAEGVFKGMLQQMSTSPDGFLDVTSNPFNCDCSFAWLFRDNRNLLPFVKGGKCCMFAFEDISSVSFNDCV